MSITQATHHRRTTALEVMRPSPDAYAIAVATPEDAKRVGSHRYITCVPRSDLATSRFLCFYFLTEEGLEKIRAASPGGAGRNRTLGLSALEAIEVPVPPIADQHWFNALQVEIDSLRTLRADTLIDLDALHLSILDSAFKGVLRRADPIQFHLAVQPSQDEYVARRASIACYIVDKLHGSSTFGRTQLMKGLYLAEAQVGVDLCGEYERQAAGPFDKSIYTLEDAARKHRWFDLQETRTASGKPKIHYVPLTGLPQKSNEGTAILGSKRQEFDRILAMFEKRTTKEVEIIATLFAAWNDLILRRGTPTDDAIVHEVLNNWHQAKRDISAERWHKTIHWMRSESFVPSGLGRVTRRLQ